MFGQAVKAAYKLNDDNVPLLDDLQIEEINTGIDNHTDSFDTNDKNANEIQLGKHKSQLNSVMINSNQLETVRTRSASLMSNPI